MLRPKRPSFAAVLAANQYEVGRDADARGQLKLRVTGSTCSGQFSSCAVNKALWTVYINGIIHKVTMA